MLKRASLLAAGAGFLSLLGNRLPFVTVSCFALACLLGVQKPQKLTWAVVAVWAFWLGSFLLTTESLCQLFSFDFQRRDGQIFFNLLPLLVLAGGAPSGKSMRAGLGVFFILQALIALVACAAHAGGWERSLLGSIFLWDEGPQPDGPGFTAFYAAHNAAGSVLALGVVVAAALAAFSAGPRARWFWGLLTIPLLWGVILSKSRGSFLAMVLGLLVLAALAVRRRALTRRAMLGVVLVVAVTAAFFGPRLVHRLGQFADAGGTHTGRWEWWKRGLEEWTWSPIVGEGLGRYNDEERQWSGVKHVYYVVTKAKVVNSAGHAHNSYVHFLAEGGIVGLGVTAGLWAWIAWKLRRSREPLRIAAFLGVLYLFAISMTEHYMGGGAMLLVLSSLVGAAWALPEPEPEAPTS